MTRVPSTLRSTGGATMPPAPPLTLAVLAALVASACQKQSGASNPNASPPPTRREAEPSRPRARAEPRSGARAHKPPPRRFRLTARPGTEGAAEFRETVQKTYDRLFCRGARPDAPCKTLDRAIARYRKKVMEPVRRFVQEHRPAPPRDTLLYPFAGGDILSAVTAFPGARRFVLLSLEQGGSPDPIALVPAKRLRRARLRYVYTLRRLLANTYSHTVDLQEPVGRRLPGLLPLMLFGLHVHGARVSSVRTFRIQPDGDLAYFTVAELKQAGRWPRAGATRGGYRRIYSDPDYNLPYSHLEIQFRLPGDTQDRVLHHVAVDLSNDGLARSPGLLAFLHRLPPHDLLIKASSFLLYKPRYRTILDALLRNAVTIVGDSSTPLPADLTRHGFEIHVFGSFRCPVLKSFSRQAKAWRRVFRQQRPRPIPFSFGYRDCKKNGNLIFAHRAPRRPRPRPSGSR